MNFPTHPPRSVVVAGGLVLAALALPLQPVAALAGPAHNEQVALVNGTDKQIAKKSHLNSTAAVASADGRYVVFSTDAKLVPSDTNGVDDVYRRDTVAGKTVLVSHRGGKVGNDYSFEPTISSDGSRIAFTTWATNLAKDTNGSTLDVLVKDLGKGSIRRVSVDSKEVQGHRNSFFPVISGNGRFVSFQTFVPFAMTDGDFKEDVYVRDVRNGTTKQVSLLPSGKDVPGNVVNGDISDNGRKIVFGKNTKIWMRDLTTGTTTVAHAEPPSAPCQPAPIGSAGRPSISGNGRYVAFASCAAALPGHSDEFTYVYRVDLTNGDIVRVRPGNGHSYLPSLSRTGQFIGFSSDASDLVAGDDNDWPDTFVFDAGQDTLVRASQNTAGVDGNSKSGANEVSISADGQTLVYTSYADNLVAGDKYDLEEAFVWRAAS
jgi:Tol biopolymer transport system component